MDKRGQERIRRIADFVPRRLDETEALYPAAGPGAAYRWQHTLRVCRYGKVIAEAEGADTEIVMAACLLHDVARFDPGNPQDHGRLGAAIVRPYLLQWDFSPDETEAICYAVATHVDVRNPDTLEAKVVSDADNVDRFGATRILLQLCGSDGYAPMMEMVTTRLERLKQYRQQVLMETPTGQALFNENLDLQIVFLSALIKEKDLAILPRL